MLKIQKNCIYTARLCLKSTQLKLKSYFLKRSVFTLGLTMELFLSRSDETLYLERRLLLNGWSQSKEL